MATALEIFDALEEVTSGVEPGTEFALNSGHRAELLKLTEKDLMARHLGKARAQEILSGIWHEDFEPLARSLGVKLVFSEDVPRLRKE